MMKRFLTAVLLLFPLLISAQVRIERLLETGWKFTREDSQQFSYPEYDDSSWQTVRIPHDWAIYGPFSINNDKQNVAITQDGQKEAMEHAGRTGGLPFVGPGWYRLEFEAPEYAEGKSCRLIFDGAMSNADVYINGHHAAFWPYGYNSFIVDATPYMKAGETNQLAVRLENYNESSRWYPGAGLYRNVHLVVTKDAYIPDWGTYVYTRELKGNYAWVESAVEFVVPDGKEFRNYTIINEIFDPQGKHVTQHSETGSAYDGNVFRDEVLVLEPQLWTPETPYLYTLKTRVYEGKTLIDEVETRFGIRTIELRPDEGFFLNGERTVFRGVCNHHDLGPLGAIVNEAGICRQVRMLKDMGCNAIRTSHNMPAPELVRICDEMGMMLMAETFDCWVTPKVQNGYNLYFEEWAEKDLVNLIRHYRNSPAVVMWCVGNEVPDQWPGDKGAKIALWLQQICHREDPTRPVTMGMDQPGTVINNNVAAVFDVPGFNYRPHWYMENYRKLPQRLILGSETASTVSSRGVYKFPVERRSMAKYPDHQASSYDVSIVTGQTFRRMTSSSMRTFHTASESSYGPDSIISESLHLIIQTGRATRLCSE